MRILLLHIDLDEGASPAIPPAERPDVVAFDFCVEPDALASEALSELTEAALKRKIEPWLFLPPDRGALH